MASTGAPTTKFKHLHWGPTHIDLAPHSAWGAGGRQEYGLETIYSYTSGGRG